MPVPQTWVATHHHDGGYHNPNLARGNSSSMLGLDRAAIAQTSGQITINAEEGSKPFRILQELVTEMEELIKDQNIEGTYEGGLARIYSLSDIFYNPIYALFTCTVSKTNERPEHKTGVSESWHYGMKWILGLGALVAYIVCLLFLVFSIQELNLCITVEHPAGLRWGDAHTNKTFTCQQMVVQCQISYLGGMPVTNYYNFRLAIYILSWIPILLIAMAAGCIADRYLEPFLYIGSSMRRPDRAANTNASSLENLRKSLRNWSVKDYLYSSAFLVVITHVVMGFFTIGADAAVASYFDGLPPADTCQTKFGPLDKPKQPFMDLLNPADPDAGSCACRLLFEDTAVFIRVSTMAYMTPRSNAVLLIIFNVVYTIYGVAFTIDFCVGARRMVIDQRKSIRRRAEENWGTAPAPPSGEGQIAPAIPVEDNRRF